MYLKLSAFTNLDGEVAGDHDNKHILLKQYAFDYDMGASEMCIRYLGMNRNQANI